MTEEEWLKSSDPEAMLKAVRVRVSFHIPTSPADGTET